MALIAVTVLLAVKLWNGRDWARQAVVVVGSAGFLLGLYMWSYFDLGPFLLPGAILLMNLALTNEARAWCDPASALHSPRIGTGPRVPFVVTAALVMLWLAVGYAVYFGVGLVVFTLEMDHRFTAEMGVWLVYSGAVIGLALFHAALNIGLTRRRNGARITIVVLMCLYAGFFGLIAMAMLPRENEETWPWLLASAVPVAFAWAMLTGPTRAWCDSLSGPG
ncbi:hypothetical protein AB0B28_03425 [Glycomyces sp. NPDC046736]|uniref:hypothetical protein n=1 Tax=Glycomyces sp. NPDC046736 TaxID=3155615 RepID=UPI0034066AE3